MKNTKVIEILENIENLVEREEYCELLDYIDKIKEDVKIDQDPASKYIDELIEDLK